MLCSKDALRTYALEQVESVAVSINTFLPVGNNSYGFAPVEPTAEGIVNTIRHMNLSVDVANPNDYLFVWAGARNSDGDLLFTGYHQFKLENAKGGYTLPENYGDVTLGMSDSIPIKINGAVSASVHFRDGNGEVYSSAPLQVYNEKVYFSPKLAGANATLLVFTEGGKGDAGGGWLYWNVGNGSSIRPEHFAINMKAIIQGIISVTDRANVVVAVPTTNSIGNNLTVEYKSTGKAFIGASFYTTEGKWFTGAWVRKAGTSDWVLYPATIGGKAVYIDISMQPGIYYIVPTWNPGDLIEPPSEPWSPPVYQGEKG